jgi:hypothetical protein
MALGFETRDLHPEPAPNEHYTKLYVFQERKGPKSVSGPYVWGQNLGFFEILTRLRLFVEASWQELSGKPVRAHPSTVRWLLPPDAAGVNPLLAWTQAGDSPSYVFLANTSAQPVGSFRLPSPVAGCRLELVFSILPAELNPGSVTGGLLPGGAGFFYCPGLGGGECLAFRVILEAV